MRILGSRVGEILGERDPGNIVNGGIVILWSGVMRILWRGEDFGYIV